jgi:dihydroflavonol-4-reductase
MQVRAADVRRGPSLDGLDIEFVEIDVLQPETLRAAFVDCEVVFHLAAVISIVGDPTGMVWRVNVDGPENAAMAALGQGVRRFVHCSSVHAFDLEHCGP